jgi:pyruvate formate lyase activating enzyme
MLFKREALAARSGAVSRREASFYRKIDETTVQCELCPRGCTLSNGQRSFCRVREVENGVLYTFAYGKTCAAHVDPIEKKPLFHFLPGTAAYSLATAGCNYRCKSCQNWQISQARPEDVYNDDTAPADIIEGAIANACHTIAYTYTEPVIFYEYMSDIARLGKARGLKNMCHSNGSFNHKPLEELVYNLDAANIDLKGFSQDFYTDFSAGQLNAVLETLKTLKNSKVWLEITNLVVPTLNDDMAKIKDMCAWIKDNLGLNVPLHFSRFWPNYKLAGLYPTPQETLERARETALGTGIRYVYIGNIAGHPAENTYCHGCGKAIVIRSGYTILENRIKAGCCELCSTAIPGIWS